MLVQLEPDNPLLNRTYLFNLRLCDNGVLSITRVRLDPKSIERFALKLDESDSLVQLALLLIGPPFGVTFDPSKV